MVFLSETNFQDDVSNKEIFPSMYDVFLYDLTTNNVTEEGGVFLAFRDGYRSLPISFSALRDTLSEVDIVGSKLVLGNFTLSIFVVNIPPSCSNSHYETLFDFLESSDPVTKGNFLLVGDFNKYDVDCNDTNSQNILNFIQATGSK
ncbi:hypothetical protein JTB14_017141 [Gonioctena quinquepunctata]|nr:hypothetical protein JTB14_017141 [Gonioctena quinquepunctata]